MAAMFCRIKTKKDDQNVKCKPWKRRKDNEHKMIEEELEDTKGVITTDRGDSGATDRQAIPAPLVAPIVLI